MNEVSVLTEILAKAGPVGILGLVVWYLVQRWIPRLMDGFREELRAERTKIDELGARVERSARIVEDALNQNLAAMRFMLARFSNVQLQDQSMTELICPHDGKACGDPLRQNRHKEAMHGTNEGGGQTRAAHATAAGTGRET